MSRKLIIILCCCFLCATLVVVALYATTRTIIHQNNSFIREYANHAAVKSGVMDIHYNSWYIAGITRKNVYLGNITAPRHVLITNHTLTDSQQVKIQFSGDTVPVIYKSTRLKINPPYFFLADGNTPVIYRGRIGTWKAHQYLKDSAYFSHILPLSSQSFAIRSNLRENQNNVLGRMGHSTAVLFNKALLQKQVDGFFCTDGILLYNNDLGKIIYTYYYRNEYLVVDSMLNLVYRAHTIDTFSRAQITVQHISSSNTNKLTARKQVNILAGTSGNFLYVRSDLRAKNDFKERFENASIFDLYDLISGTYRFSFTIPKQNGKHVRDFMVYDNKILFALHSDHIVRYDLRQQFFP